MAPDGTWRLIRHLGSLPTRHWGFSIYRTTYTPLSQQRFPDLIKTINSYMKRSILKEHGFNPALLTEPRRATYEMLCDCYRPTILDNTQLFNNISLPSVRSHFEAWSEQQHVFNPALPSQLHACLVIDDEMVNALADARPWVEGVADDAVDRKFNRLGWWVKVVEAWPDLEETLDGTMRVLIFELWRLWTAIHDPVPPIAHLERHWDCGGLYLG
ncbi:uncharacterized protein DSM5745_09808 [Aspergillus mulundensis]|uniref:Uncharacterized protein n=1 Tax=Aspergillus mulundensis TaxID=1810919 RepID=A0A3D8QRI5_9EURO|nr:hypothetical protein DSM5745_09808 [Aspergillus mulundensis]RDW64397.1 hypothetical protein DSM5745_09808 [Aspergillus mulundensis]